MKAVATAQKLRGGYYTPERVATFLTEWAIQSPSAVVLEPSCGDGEFLVAASTVLVARAGSNMPVGTGHIVGVEIDYEEAQKASNRIKTVASRLAPVDIRIGDFFSQAQNWIERGEHFDVVIGNPPFIRYQNFMEEHRDPAFQIMRQAGLHPNRLTNAWVPFLVAATLLLKQDGRTAMVIPAELLQVDYAAELRSFLSTQYNRITLITFKRLVFDGIQQEIVLLLGERSGASCPGIRTIELESMADLVAYEHTGFSAAELKPLDHNSEKWTRYFLERHEIDFLREIAANPKLVSADHLIDVDVGIVTGLNEFFVLTEQQVALHNLEPYTQRIVGRSAHLPGIIFTETAWKANAENNYPAYLLRLPDVPADQLPTSVQDYVALGEAKGLNKGYKCRIRRHWYTVPSVWTPEAFMLRQIHAWPKIIVNQAGATCTDTIHRVKLLNGTSAATIAGAFLNSLTFAFTEVMGRSYGGGVLELEPKEVDKLPLPMQGATELNLRRINDLILDGRMSEVLDITDEQLLKNGLGLNRTEIALLRTIWEKLRDRRINRR